MMSDSFMIRSSSPSSLISVPDHLPNSTRSPTLRSIGISLPDSSRPPGPTAVIALRGFFLGAVQSQIRYDVEAELTPGVERKRDISCTKQKIRIARGLLFLP